MKYFLDTSFGLSFNHIEGFPHSSVCKEFTHNAGDPGSIPGSGSSPGEGKSYVLQYSGLENSMESPWGCKEWDMIEQLSLLLSGFSTPSSQTLVVCEQRTSRCSSCVLKRQRNQRSNCQNLLAYGESKKIPENSYFCFIDYAKAFDCVNHNCGKF